jgi:hypothetical protein
MGGGVSQDLVEISDRDQTETGGTLMFFSASCYFALRDERVRISE